MKFCRQGISKSTEAKRFKLRQLVEDMIRLPGEI